MCSDRAVLQPYRTRRFNRTGDPRVRVGRAAGRLV